MKNTIIVQGIRSNKFLPLAIQFFMWLYRMRVNFVRWVLGKPLLPKIKTCNHWSVIVNGKEWEAIGKGVVRRDYNIDGHKYVKEWEVETNFVNEVVYYLNKQVGKGYEVSNFLFHILKVMGFRWLGSWNDNHHSCVELVNRALQIAGVDTINKYDNPYQTQYKLDLLLGGKVIKS